MLLVWISQTLGFYGFIALVPSLLAKHVFLVVQSFTYTSLIAICNPLGALDFCTIVRHGAGLWGGEAC